MARDRPKWDVPSRYGRAAAIQTMGGIAAPVLAGFALTLSALVVSAPETVRWVNLTLGLLVLGAFALIASLQCTFHAREWHVTPAEIEEWWPNPDDERRAELRREQIEHRRGYARWEAPARFFYNVGILAFTTGFVTALVPPGDVTGGRMALIIVALVGPIAELVWVAEDTLTRQSRDRG